MTTADSFTFDFPLMSELSQRPPHAIPHDEVMDELNQELEWRRAVYPRQVERKTMTKPEADLHIDILAAIRDDLNHVYHVARQTWVGQRHGWATKVAELRRELAIRRGAWPRRIANVADPMSSGVAVRRMEALEALHFKYWMELFGSDREFPGVGEAVLDAIRAAHWRRWTWYQDAQTRGGRDALCVPPGIAQLLADVAAQEPEALRTWALFAKHGGAAEPVVSEPAD